MPRCVACDKNLNDYETTRKLVREDKSVSYPDLCNKCFEESGLRNIAVVIERADLMQSDDIEAELDEIEYDESLKGIYG